MIKVMVVLLMVFLSACGGGSGGSNSGSSDTNVVRHMSLAVEERGYSTKYLVTYEFGKNGCTTGEQEVYETSEDRLMFKLCMQLADDDLNKNCVQDMRREAFDQNCGDYSWKKMNVIGGNE
jgi:hypothetical protein